MRYYDQFATNCPGCGWLEAGIYPDGLPYMACTRYGYILHGQSDEQCDSRRSPQYVAEIRRKNAEAEAKRLRESWSKQKRRKIEEQFEDSYD